MVHFLEHVKFMADTGLLGRDLDTSLCGGGPVVTLVHSGVFSFVNETAHAVDIVEFLFADGAEIGPVDYQSARRRLFFHSFGFATFCS